MTLMLNRLQGGTRLKSTKRRINIDRRETELGITFMLGKYFIYANKYLAGNTKDKNR